MSAPADDRILDDEAWESAFEFVAGFAPDHPKVNKDDARLRADRAARIEREARLVELLRHAVAMFRNEVDEYEIDCAACLAIRAQIGSP